MRALLISGSPTESGSTEVLLRALGDGIRSIDKDVSLEFVRLNDLSFIPCQSCAVSPQPDLCFYKDDLWPVYEQMVNCDIIVLASPVFFDSVSGQTKSFIDRCSCFRPPDFDNVSEHNFLKIGLKRRVGAGILVAGERGRFDLARSVMKGFFKWTEVDCEGFIQYETPSYHQAALVQQDSETMTRAKSLGVRLAEIARERAGQS